MSKPVLVGDVVFKRPFADREAHERDAAASAVVCREEVLTVQAGKLDADINEIVRRFGIDGELPVSRFPARFGDFSSSQSYHDAMSQVAAARSAFMELPARVRSAFRNDPGALIRALEVADGDPEVRAQLEELGLVNAVEAVAPLDAGASVAPVAPVAPGSPGSSAPAEPSK